ncbi:MAG: ATP-binding cassette domain-containing protein, partial [Pseudomonadota bacterium]|nr:ATP-binding cassette domain-containing protein [Pseudomonadota bacterium]
MTPRLALRNLTKRYASVLANDAVSLDVMPGEIVALLGENGAGKSTLMKVVYGGTRPDAGTIAVDGVVVDIDSPRRARALGIAMVFQQFALFDSLSVLQNVALGLSAAPLAAIEARALALAARYGLEIVPQRRVHDLSIGERQRIEILRVLMSGPRVLILDEPT